MFTYTDPAGVEATSWRLCCKRSGLSRIDRRLRVCMIGQSEATQHRKGKERKGKERYSGLYCDLIAIDTL